MNTQHVFIPYRGELLVLTPEQLAEARRRGRQHAASYIADVDNDDYLTIAQVVERAGLARSSVYASIARKSFPAPVVVSAPGCKRAVRWRARGVAEWMRERAT